jgi:hypothetical protein
VGPTLPRDEVAELSGLVVHGPAALGDVYALAQRSPFAIGIIDGYFDRMRAVWHKEILWALSHGVHVFGAASMGALRGAELHDFGMVGVGQVFAAFRDGELEGDDEVALVHADAAHGFRTGSEAMVNVRATLAFAANQGIISNRSCARLTEHMKRLYYPERHYAALFSETATQARGLMDPGESSRLREWLKHDAHHVDVKRKDARELVSALCAFRDADPGPKRVSWTFQHTDAWEQVRRGLVLGDVGCSSPARDAGAVLNLLRLEPDAYFRLRDRTRLRIALASMAQAEGHAPTDHQLRQTMARFVQEHTLDDEAAIRGWLTAQRLGAGELERLLEQRALAEWAERRISSTLELDMIDTLRLEGSYADWVARVRKRTEQLVARFRPLTPRAERSELITQFFALQGLPVPAGLDCYARELGLVDADELATLIVAYHGSSRTKKS